MKKFVSIALASLMALVLFAGCGGGSGAASGGSTAANDSTPASTGGTGSAAGSEAAPANTGNAEFEFNVNYTVPESSGKGLKDYCDSIEEQSGGRIKFNHYFANSLMSIPEIPKGLQDGIADISYMPVTNYQQQFPLNAQILAVPFLGLPNLQAASDIFAKLYEEFPELSDEMTSQGITPLSSYPNAPYQIMMASGTEIKVPEDMNGLKLINSSPELSELIAQSGGAPVNQPPTEYYSSLEKGVADGVINHLPAGMAFGILPELTEQVILFGDKGLYYNYVITGMRTASLEKLPEDLQALFFGDNVDTMRQTEVDVMSGTVDACVKMQEDAGKTIVTLTDDEIKVWQDATVDFREATISALEADQPVARAIYDRAIELIAEYDS